MLKEYKLYGGKVRIMFDDEKHYFYGPNGENLLSVSKITGLMDKSAPLMWWATDLMGEWLKANFQKGMDKMDFEELVELSKKKYREMQRKEADIGTQIHDWVSKWILGKKPEMPEDLRVLNGITAFLKMQKEHGIKWLESERIVYSRKYGYAGILDAIGKSKDWGLVLADFKSGSGIYEDMVLQTAGYQIPYEEETGKKIDTRLVIRFGKDTGEFMIRDFTEHEKDKEAFLGLLPAKKRELELKKLLRGFEE